MAEQECRCEELRELEADSLSWASDADCYPSGKTLRDALKLTEAHPHPECEARDHEEPTDG